MPIPHCIYGSDGWQLVYDTDSRYVVQKETFGSNVLARRIVRLANALLVDKKVDTVELVGVCTGICVLSNAVLIKSSLPEMPIIVDASCCACVTPESHKTALEAMKLLQIEVINE